MARTTSNPFARGRLMSRMAIVGLRDRTCSSAVTPSLASATMSIQSTFSSASRMPSRKNGWSSAMTTRTRSAMVSMCRTRKRERHRQHRSGLRAGLNVDASAEDPGTLANPTQAKAISGRAHGIERLGTEAGAVVFDSNLDRRGRFRNNRSRVARAGVLDDVADRFLNDSEDVDVRVLWKQIVDRADVHEEFDVACLADSPDHALDRLRQADRVELIRPQIVGDVLHIRVHPFGHRANLVQRRLNGFGIGGLLLMRPRELPDDAQILAERVVHFIGDAFALAFLGVDQLLREG